MEAQVQNVTRTQSGSHLGLSDDKTDIGGGRGTESIIQKRRELLEVANSERNGGGIKNCAP
jgi:hypothetical protein